ncbi:MAG: hypothetical protein K0U66_02010 [Gammaproteobacteria bacterium]|nr:hypothetical protein [Pseudomonadota bacterium]MCH9662417.1 hypothetical protein [Gammaproteobacteria bacterium]
MKSTHPNYISLSLHRLSLLAFAVCIVSVVAVVLMGLALSVRQPVLVAVDDRGRLHGYIEYLQPSQRTDDEIRLATVQFVQAYLSVSSATITADLQLALMMMSTTMAEEEKQTLIETNRIAITQKSRLSGRVLITDVQFERSHSDAVAVSVSGHIEAAQSRRPFDILLQTRIVPRTIANTLGVRIESIRDL